LSAFALNEVTVRRDTLRRRHDGEKRSGFGVPEMKARRGMLRAVKLRAASDAAQYRQFANSGNT